MGHYVHRIVVVTTWNTERLNDVIAKAGELRLPISPVLASDWNDYDTIMTIPNGSGDGREPQIEHEAKLEEFTAYLESQRYEDGSTCLEWFYASYGSDPGEAVIVRHGCEQRTV